MKKSTFNRLLALAIAIGMLFALAACSGGGSQAPAQSAETSQPASEAPAAATPAAKTPASKAPAETSDAAEPAKTITYPIPGDYSFTMVQNLMNHAAAVLDGKDYSAQYSYKTIAEKTGVEIQFKMLPETSYSEQLNLIIASQDYPDIFGQGIGSYDDNPIKAIEDDVIIDFKDLMTGNMPQYQAILDSDPDYADAVYNTDGSLSKITSRNIGIQSLGMYIRGDWLDKLGLAVPTTVDEMTEVLKAFKTEFSPAMGLLVNADLDDGMAGTFNHSMIGFTRQMLSFQLTAPDSGVVVSTVASEGYIQHLTLLRQYYADGIINGDFLNISKENGNFESSYYTGVCGIWTDGCEVASPSYAKNSPDPDWVATPIVTPVVDGQVNHMSTFTASTTGMSALYISTACAHPEIVLQYLNYGFTGEGKDLVAFGIEGETYTVDENGNVAYTELLTNYPDGVRAAEWFYLCSGWLPTEQQQRALNMKYTSEEPVAAYQMWTEAAKQGDDAMTVPRQVTLTTEEQDIVSSHRGDLCTHFAEASAKYIMGDIDEAGYRQAIADAGSLGLEEVTQVYQDAYDRYLASQG